MAANLPAGASIDAVNHMIDVHGNNVTLSGYDFSLHGGWGVTIEAGTTGTTTISNSNFVMGSGEPIAINAQSTNVGNLTVLNDTFNGTQQNIPSVQPPPAGSGLSGAINYNGNGTFVAEYNDIFNMPGDGIDFSSGTVTPTIEYNLFAGLGYTPGAHADPVQFYGDTVNNAVIDFNTIYSPQGSNKSANEGLQIEAQGGSTITNTQIENNVIIATGPTMTQSLSIATWQDSGNTLSGVTVTNNYVDPTASYGALGTGSNAPQGSGLVFNNNINMLTGAAIANPAGSSTGTADRTSHADRFGAVGLGGCIQRQLTVQRHRGRNPDRRNIHHHRIAFRWTVGPRLPGIADRRSASGGHQVHQSHSRRNCRGRAGALCRRSGLRWHNHCQQPASLSSSGTTSFNVTAPAGQPPSSTLTLNMSEHALQGNAQFTVKVDGQSSRWHLHRFGVAGRRPVQHLRTRAALRRTSVRMTSRSPSLTAVNGGTTATDRNLYMNSAQFDGVNVAGSTNVSLPDRNDAALFGHRTGELDRLTAAAINQRRAMEQQDSLQPGVRPI